MDFNKMNNFPQSLLKNSDKQVMRRLYLLLLLMSLSTASMAQLTPGKPPSEVVNSFDDTQTPTLELGKDGEYTSYDLINLKVNQFVKLIKDQSKTYPNGSLNLDGYNFINLRIFLFLENTMNPPKTCCGSEQAKLSPVLQHLLTKEAIELLKSMMSDKQEFEQYLIERFKVDAQGANSTYNFFQELLKHG